MRVLRVRKRARAEIEKAFDWYAARSATAADQFVAAVDAAMKDIELDPERNRMFCGRLRRVFLAHYPYYVCYKVYPRVISVVGVLHVRRDPDVVRRRAAR
jgi:plasmid stabilization system protein ParE